MEYREGALNHTIKAATLYGSAEPVVYHIRNVDGTNFLKYFRMLWV